MTFEELKAERNEIDYMCEKCDRCVFFEEVKMGMGGTVYLCKANKPKDTYFDGHIMRWVSAQDCYRNSEINKFYDRKCKNYCSYAKLRQQKLKELSKNP